MMNITPRVSPLPLDIMLPPHQLVKTGMEETKKARAPQILYSGGVGPCIVLGVHDPVTKTAYMTHSSDYTDSHLKSFIKTLQRDYGDLSRLGVIAFGGSLSMHPDCVFGRELALRDRLEEILMDVFPSPQLQLSWMRPLMSGVLYLYAKTGETVTHAIPMESHYY